MADALAQLSFEAPVARAIGKALPIMVRIIMMVMVIIVIMMVIIMMIKGNDYDNDDYDNGDDDADFVFSPVFHRHPLGRNWSHASPSCQQILNKNKKKCSRIFEGMLKNIFK